ncbi:hypothetical protein HPP92_027568 [Vanilla planifolia]|uniref:USP8 dimerisation domain-containing protein n=1 Tax=Vanilla planifolia TaxID=51239 RepID=A0A835U5T0_VANPL|nr:hypothetical protein HPP92_027568 [Vanilla planifolia]
MTESRRVIPVAGAPRRAVNINALSQKVEVDNRISLHYYYRIADNLLRQASIYREEKNLIDLYIILLRFSSLICETIPSHRDYQLLLPKQKATFRKKLLDVVNELEALKPMVQHQIDEINGEHMYQTDANEGSNCYDSDFVRKHPPSSPSTMQSVSQLLHKQTIERSQVLPPDRQMDTLFRKLTLNTPYPKEETLSRHSILGPNGLRGQWAGPITGIRVQYPRNIDLEHSGMPGVNQMQSHEIGTYSESNSKGRNSDMDSVLSLDDGSWSVTEEESHSFKTDAAKENYFQLNIRQPSTPPVLAEVWPEVHPISPSKVADPRPGLPKLPQEGDSKSYQKLHVHPISPSKVADPRPGLPKLPQEGDSKSYQKLHVEVIWTDKHGNILRDVTWKCQTTDEEEIFNIQDERSLFPLGWIHVFLLLILHPASKKMTRSYDQHRNTYYSIYLKTPPSQKEDAHYPFLDSIAQRSNPIRIDHERGVLCIVIATSASKLPALSRVYKRDT